MAKKKTVGPVPVDAIKHVADKRPNIPTRETAAFAKEIGGLPFVLNRDPSLDPQLVWKGKDEQDANPREIPVVPIHVQEKLQPLAIVEDIKKRAGSRERPVESARGANPRGADATPLAVQLDLFADFNGLDDFSKKLEFYQPDQH